MLWLLRYYCLTEEESERFCAADSEDGNESILRPGMQMAGWGGSWVARTEDG